MGEQIRIHITDDHGVFRSGVRALVEREPDMVVVSEAADSDSTLELVQREKPDIVLLDINIPGMGAAKVARQILESNPQTAILVLTFHDEEHYLREFLRLGARGFMLKTSTGDALIDALRKVYRGEEYVDPALAKHLVASYVGRPKRAKDRADLLTAREREVCSYLAAGYTNVEVAEALAISKRTVETHRAAIMSKVGLRSRADLVQFALEHGLWRGK